ncbi:hypothetical protein [Thermococcus sp. 21S7]|uniref:hypothetical protein n=1 Tax=Thermococcus sp. 21S7 TaxID=1638221 RepID=UPI00143AA87C|nr:hypothetical protein [Thermococcus sp. 21S7]NJE61189.1 hypothetical protein [Thermococcus sp. 21S7]
MKKIIVVLTVVLFLGSVVSGAAVYSIPVESKEYLGTKIEYKRSFLFGPSLEVELPEKGYGIVTASLLLPNGSLVKLGTFSGKDRVKINYGRVLAGMKEWMSYLRGASLDPAGVNPAVILVGTVHTNDGDVDYFMQSIPLNVKRILEKKTVKTRIPKENVKSLHTTSESKELFFEVTKHASSTPVSAQNSWVPDQDFRPEDCVPVSRDGYACYYWKLEEVIASKSGTLIPLAALEITGDTERLHSVVIKVSYGYLDISAVELAFSAAGVVEKKSGGSISKDAQILGFSYTIDTRELTLSYPELRLAGDKVPSPSVVGAGVKGNVALAKYRLHYLYYSRNSFIDKKLDDVAYVIVGKPDETDMKPRLVVEPGPSSMYGGTFQRTMSFIHRYWEPSLTVSKNFGILVEDFEFVRRHNTISLFSASMAALATLGTGQWEFAPFVVAIGVGLTENKYGHSIVIIDVNLKDESYSVTGKFYTSKVKFYYKGKRYHLSGIYGDIFIPGDGGGNPPCDPRTGICPDSTNPGS